MQRYFSALLAVTLLIMAGCGSKSSPTNSTAPKPIRVVVMADSLVAPSLSDPNDAIWNGVGATGIATAGGNTPYSAALTSLSDSAFVQGIRMHDTLYLRLRWRDSSHDIWRDAYRVHDTLLHCTGDTTVFCPNFVRDTDSQKEDQTIILFKGLPNSAWDALVWRALTTGEAHLAMGANYIRDTVAGVPQDSLLIDSSLLQVAYENIDIGGFGLPGYMSRDSSRFHGAVLYAGDPATVSFRLNSRGWSVGQRIPGWYIDTSVVNKTAAARGSRWTTQVIDVWDSTTQTYTVVFEHPMNSGFSDDLNLVPMDSVETEIGFFDNLLVLNQGGIQRGFTKSFWLILK